MVPPHDGTYNILKDEVIAIFHDNPSKRLPFVTFQLLFEKRYHRSFTRSDLRRLKDVIQLSTQSSRDDLGSSLTDGKYISLNSRYKQMPNSPSSNASRLSCQQRSPPRTTRCSNPPAYCPIHYRPNPTISIWRFDEEPYESLPAVNVSLAKLGPRIHALLASHDGLLPLNSILNCYEAEFGEEFDVDGEDVVPLEHLISCIHGVELVTNQMSTFKCVQWRNVKSLNTASSNGSSPSSSPSSFNSNSNYHSLQSRRYEDITSINQTNEVMKNLNLFSREVKDLLKSQRRCTIAFFKFVPAYHNHFGRQCCVYQFGYTKLVELLEAIPNVVQIIGHGQKRLLTLTHREQTKRFVSDLIRVLKSVPNKRITIGELDSAFERVLGRPFAPADYGVCNIADILRDVWEGTVTTTPSSDGDEKSTVIEMPRKEQTVEERQRTQLFARDVIELVQSTPNFSILFSKFIPTYHHYFNRQCKVSDYGFMKLIELFESISPAIVDIDEINGLDGEKIIRLAPDVRNKIFNSRLVKLVGNEQNQSCFVDRLEELYHYHYGNGVNISTFGYESFEALISELCPTLRIIKSNCRPLVTAVGSRLIKDIEQRLVRILSESDDGKMTLDDLCMVYSRRFFQKLEVDLLTRDLIDLVAIDGDSDVRLIKSELISFKKENMIPPLSVVSKSPPLNWLKEIADKKQDESSVTIGKRTNRLMVNFNCIATN